MVARSVSFVAHFEWIDGGAGEPTWWAESDDLPGFTAVYPSLGELQREAEACARFTLDDDLEFTWVAGEESPEWAAVHVEFVRPAFARDCHQSRSWATLEVGDPTHVSGAVPR